MSRSLTSFGITISMRLEVITDTLEEGFLSQVICQHSNNRASFEITDILIPEESATAQYRIILDVISGIPTIKNLVHIKSIFHRNFNRMRAAKRV